MKFTAKLNLILESQNKKFAWSNKGTWELIFGGYDVQDTYDLIPIDKNAFPSNVKYESKFGHIASITGLQQLIQNQKNNSHPISTFKNFEKEYATMPSGGGTLIILRGETLFGSDVDSSSIPDKKGQRRFINSGEFYSDDRYIDIDGFPKDFLDREEYTKWTEFKNKNIEIKTRILKEHLSLIKKIIVALKNKTKGDKNYDKSDFKTYNDPHDFSLIRTFEYFGIVDKILSEVDAVEVLEKLYTMADFNKLKSKMIAEYFGQLKVESEKFWKNNRELLSKILLPKKSNFKTGRVEWNEFVVSNYQIEKIYFFDFVKYYTDKRQDASILKEALEKLKKILQNNNLKSKIIIEEFSSFPAKVATVKKLKAIQDEIKMLIEEINKTYSNIIKSKSAFQETIKQELIEIKSAEIKSVI